MSKVTEFFKKRKKSILQLLGSLCMLMVAAAIGILAGLNETNNVDKYVNEAVEYIDDANWVALYQYAEIIDNDFINEVFFEELAEDVYGSPQNGTITVDEIEEDEDTACATITYKTADGKTSSCKLYFEQKDEKNYLFFPKWKLDIDKSIIRNSTITVPTGFAVYLDGVELSRDNAYVEKNENSGLTVYTIPRLFKGDHTIYFKKEGIEVVEAAVIWNDNKSAYQLDTEELQLAQSQADIVGDISLDIVAGMYSAIFNESGIAEVSEYFKQDEATIAMLTAVYDNMLAAINPDDGSTLNSIDITEFNVENIDYTYPDYVDMTLSFECSFEARGARNDKGGVREKYEGTSTSQIEVRFVKDGDNWSCENLNMTCIDYSKPEEEETAE